MAVAPDEIYLHQENRFEKQTLTQKLKNTE